MEGSDFPLGMSRSSPYDPHFASATAVRSLSWGTDRALLKALASMTSPSPGSIMSAQICRIQIIICMGASNHQSWKQKFSSRIEAGHARTKDVRATRSLEYKCLEHSGDQGNYSGGAMSGKWKCAPRETYPWIYPLTATFEREGEQGPYIAVRGIQTPVESERAIISTPQNTPSGRIVFTCF